jgi:signal transduction histidine kinase
MPADFWVGLVVGLAAWLVSAAVFAFRPADKGARYLLLSGAATLLFAPASVMYATRELAMDGTLFRWASDLNFFGGSLFAASFVALLLYYPRRLAPAWAGMAVVGLYVVWFVLQQLEVFESMTFARRFLVMIGVGSTFVLAGVHWFGTRRDPVARAALQWFLLSWLLGTGLFALFILLPQTFGVDTTPLQGYAFLLFLLVYGGLAFGILRYRLFDLGAWWRRAAVWTVSVLVLILLDAFFLFGLHLSTAVSFSLALLLCGALWLPLRSWVWHRFAMRREKPGGDTFGRVMDIALAPPGTAREKLWRDLLGSVFDPLGVERADATAADILLEREGQAMTLPAVGALPALRLEYARGGRALFSPQDAALAGELVSMLRHGMESVTLYEKGVIEERKRIARDVHDNIGAQLLAALHHREPARKDEMIRETLADLRDMINNLTSRNLSLEETLAELRVETADRLAAAGIGLHWTCDASGNVKLDPAATHALRSIVREAVSNVIRHARAENVRVKVFDETEKVLVEITDDGCGFDPAADHGGNGLANIRARLQRLGGTLEWQNTNPGMRLALRLPVGDRIEKP